MTNPQKQAEEQLNSIVENTPFVNRFLAAIENLYYGNDINVKALKREQLSYLVNVYLNEHSATLKDDITRATLLVDKERLQKFLMDYAVYVAGIEGAMMGLACHPTYKQEGGYYISQASMEKIATILEDARKERQKIDNAITSQAQGKESK